MGGGGDNNDGDHMSLLTCVKADFLRTRLRESSDDDVIGFEVHLPDVIFVLTEVLDEGECWDKHVAKVTEVNVVSILVLQFNVGSRHVGSDCTFNGCGNKSRRNKRQQEQTKNHEHRICHRIVKRGV